MKEETKAEIIELGTFQEELELLCLNYNIDTFVAGYNFKESSQIKTTKFGLDEKAIFIARILNQYYKELP